MKLSRGSTSEQVHGRGLALPRPPKSCANDVAARMASNTAQAAANVQSVSQSVSHNCSCCQLPTRSVTGCMKPQFSSAAHHVQTNACNRCQRLPEHNTVALPNCMVAALPGAQRCRSNKFEAFGTIEMFCRSDWLSWR